MMRTATGLWTEFGDELIDGRSITLLIVLRVGAVRSLYKHIEAAITRVRIDALSILNVLDLLIDGTDGIFNLVRPSVKFFSEGFNQSGFDVSTGDPFYVETLSSLIESSFDETGVDRLDDEVFAGRVALVRYGWRSKESGNAQLAHVGDLEQVEQEGCAQVSGGWPDKMSRACAL